MRRAALLGVLAGAAFAAGCVVDASPDQGDLTLSWTFAGAGCQASSVGSVNVRLFDAAGNPFVDDVFACSAATATYTALAEGAYGYDLTGLSPGGTRLYEGSGTVNVRRGDNAYTIDLSLPQ